jgi:hypothetical protein
MSDEKARIDQAAAAFEEKRAGLYRPDGSKLFADAEHDEREAALRREFSAALDHIGPAIEKRIETAAEDAHQLEHRDPSGSLSSEELERANARRAFVADEVFGLSTDALAERMRAVAAAGDRPGMFLYTHHVRAKTPGSEAEGLQLKELVSELESALDPDRAKRREQAAKALEEARELKSYSYYRKHGARDAASLHMDRTYGQVV